MNKKRFARTFCFLSALMSAAPASAFIDVGGTSLHTETRLSATHETYFIGSTDHSPDTHASLAPQIIFGRNAGFVTLHADGGVRFTRYEKHKSYDSEDIHGSVRLKLPDQKEGAGNRLSGSFSGGYHEGVEISQEVDDRVYSETFRIGADFELQLNEHSALGESVNFNTSTRNIYSDQTLFSNDLSYIYFGATPGARARAIHTYHRTYSAGSKVPLPTGDPLNPLAKTPKIDQTAHAVTLAVDYPVYGEVIGTAMLGYRVLMRTFGETRSGTTRDQGLTYGLTFQGPFLSSTNFPSVRNTFTIAYQESATPGINDSGGKTLTGDLKLAWEPVETTRFHTHVTRSMQLGISDLTYINTSVGAGADQRLGKLNLMANVDYTWREFRGVEREDNQFDFITGLSFPLYRFFEMGANYQYTWVNVPDDLVWVSGTTLRDYDREAYTVYLSIRF